MQSRWMYSQFFTDAQLGMMAPVATAYGTGWQCPIFPTDEGGSSLCQILCNTNQIEAARQDPRIIVCPLLFDPTPLEQTIIDAYASQGAKAGMSLGALIATLAEIEPNYGVTIS